MSATGPTLPAPDVLAAVKLKTACDTAYVLKNNSCSHAVWYVITNIADPQFQWREANAMVDFFNGSPDWKDVSLDDGATLALKGVVVVGGLKNTAKADSHGHVIVVYPGPNKASGGYSYTYKDKKTGLMKTDVLRSHGNYPPALSTSNGAWPGAKSKGDKTVWDPWASDDLFKQVKFWTRK